MCMYRADLYSVHNESLMRFIDRFNSNPTCRNLVMLMNLEENYGTDGYIIDTNTGKTVGFDFCRAEKQIFDETGALIYKRMSLIESKINLKNVNLYISTDLNERSFTIGWHEDLLKEKTEHFTYMAAGGEKLTRPIRFTKHFATYQTDGIEEFKLMLNRAISTDTYNFVVF